MRHDGEHLCSASVNVDDEFCCYVSYSTHYGVATLGKEELPTADQSKQLPNFRDSDAGRSAHSRASKHQNTPRQSLISNRTPSPPRPVGRPSTVKLTYKQNSTNIMSFSKLTTLALFALLSLTTSAAEPAIKVRATTAVPTPFPRSQLNLHS